MISTSSAKCIGIQCVCVCVLNMHASLCILPYRYDCFSVVRNISIEKKSIIIGCIFVIFSLPSSSSSSFTASSVRMSLMYNRLDQDPLSHVWYLTCVVCYTAVYCLCHTACCMSGIQVDCVYTEKTANLLPLPNEWRNLLKTVMFRVV